MQHFCFWPHFSWAELKNLRLFLWRQKAYFSQILLTNLYKSVLVSISRCWLDSVIIAQVCLRLATIKCHSKMCSFTVLGGSGQYLVWPPFASRSATHLLRIELIRLLIVACGMLVHSSSMAVRSCWILAGTVTRCRIRRSRASQTWSMGDMSGEYAGYARIGMFSASRNCVQILATCGRALSCCNMRWWSWMNGTTMGLRISSWYLCAFKMPSIKCTCVHCP